MPSGKRGGGGSRSLQSAGTGGVKGPQSMRSASGAKKAPKVKRSVKNEGKK